MTKITVKAGSDHLAKLSKSAPIAALSELIWNALDADAKEVKVVLHEGSLDQVEELVVSDNGVGLPADVAEERFGQLGGSWKRRKGVTDGGRFLHGSEGKGRFKALSIGRVSTWNVVYDDLVDRKKYQIVMRGDEPNKIDIGDVEVAEPDAKPGITVRIEEVGRSIATFCGEEAIGDLTENFATYLTDYADVRIYINGIQLDPTPLIVERVTYELEPILIAGRQRSAALDLIEWSGNDRRTLYLANERGAPLQKANRKFQVGGAKFTGYLRSDYISELQEAEALELAELNEHVYKWINQAQDLIKDHFDKKRIETNQSIIQEWKDGEVYPFKEGPASPVEQAERQVFDIVATHVAKHVDAYRSGPKESQALHLRLLRQAIEKSPDELQLILNEVLNLPKREQQTLAELLSDVSLSNVINASAVVADRLKLIMGLQTIMFESDYRRKLKERSQLHRILALNTWIFGDDWTLSADDRSLTQVLRAHKEILKDEIEIDAPVKHVSKSKGIVDLMLSKTSRRYGSRRPSHLVVELKRPSVSLGFEEIKQIIEYARTVSGDPRFNKVDADWEFWLISNEIDEGGAYMVKNGAIQTADENVRIYVKTWGEILEENRGRLQFFKELLDYEATEDSGLAHLNERYSELLKGVVEIDDEPSEPEAPELLAE